MSFCANLEVVEITECACKAIDPHTAKAYKRVIDFNNNSGSLSGNDLAHFETVLKKR